MAEMTLEETRTFLNERHLANLVTVKPDGSPHVMPVWYYYDGMHLLVFTGTGSVKVRNLLNDPRIAVSIASEDRPYRAVIMEGHGELRRDAIRDVVHLISQRYLGPKEGRAYAEDSLKRGDVVVIVVHPDKTITWDYGDEV